MWFSRKNGGSLVCMGRDNITDDKKPLNVLLRVSLHSTDGWEQVKMFATGSEMMKSLFSQNSSGSSLRNEFKMDLNLSKAVS